MDFKEKFMDVFLKYLRLKMQEKNMSRQQLAEICGVSKRTISRYFSKEQVPDGYILGKIYTALRLPMEDIYYNAFIFVPWDEVYNRFLNQFKNSIFYDGRRQHSFDIEQRDPQQICVHTNGCDYIYDVDTDKYWRKEPKRGRPSKNC